MRAKFPSGNNSGKKVLLVIYLPTYGSSKSTFFMLNVALDFLLSTVFAKEIGVLRFLQYKDYRNIFTFALCFDMNFFIKVSLFSIMVIIIFYSILTSLSNSHFQQ